MGVVRAVPVTFGVAPGKIIADRRAHPGIVQRRIHHGRAGDAAHLAFARALQLDWDALSNAVIRGALRKLG